MNIIHRPDPDADTEVGEAHEEHHNVGDEEEILGALLPPVQTVQVTVPHCPVAHPPSHNLSTFLKSLSTPPLLGIAVLSNIKCVRCLPLMTQSLLVIPSYQRGTE